MSFNSILTVITGNLLNRFVGAVLDAALPEINDHFKNVCAQLDRIESQLEAQSAAPLKAALTFLMLGDKSRAIERLVEAEAREAHSPAAKFWLGVLLFEAGKKDVGILKLTEALLVNPYCAPVEFWNFSGLMRAGESLDRSPANWGRSLNDAAFLAALPYRTGFGKLMAKSIKESAIYAVSYTGDDILVRWSLGVFDGDSYSFLSLFDIASGACKWSVSLEEGKSVFSSVTSDLCYATPRYAVVRNTEYEIGLFSNPDPKIKSLRYELRGLEDGRFIANLNSSYYKAVFCPNHDRLADMAEFRRSNVVFPMMRRLNEFVPSLSPAVRNMADSDIGIPGRVGKTIESVSDFFGVESVKIDATIEWYFEKENYTNMLRGRARIDRIR